MIHGRETVSKESLSLRLTDTPEIPEIPEIPDPPSPMISLILAQVCIMTRNACPQNFSFLAHLLSKLQHLKKMRQLSAKLRFLRSEYF